MFKKKLFNSKYIVFVFILFISTIVININMSNIVKQNNEENEHYANNVEQSEKVEGNENIISKDLYPDLYVRGESPVEIYEKKVCYLTFDDGPSNRTLEILDILDSYAIKGTFFVTGHNSGEHSQNILKEIVNRGHQIGVHTWSHKYKSIYKSVESYLEDFNNIYKYILETTGYRTEIFRFPGGSVNAFNRNIYKEIINEMTSRGFKYYDWNVSSDDSLGRLSKVQIVRNSINNIDKLDRVILLCHDNEDKKTTVSALDDIINYYKNNGYKFDFLRREIKPIVMNFK